MYIYTSFEMIHMQIEGYRSHSYLFKFKKSIVRTLEVRQEEKKKKKRKAYEYNTNFFPPTRFNNYDHRLFREVLN